MNNENKLFVNNFRAFFNWFKKMIAMHLKNPPFREKIRAIINTKLIIS